VASAVISPVRICTVNPSRHNDLCATCLHLIPQLRNVKKKKKYNHQEHFTIRILRIWFVSSVREETQANNSRELEANAIAVHAQNCVNQYFYKPRFIDVWYEDAVIKIDNEMSLISRVTCATIYNNILPLSINYV